MINKKITLLLVLPLILSSCQGDVTTSSSNTSSNTTSSSTTSSQNSDVLPNIDTPKSITDLFNYLSNDGLKKEISNGVSFTRNITSLEMGIYTLDTSIETQNGKSYENQTLTIEGSFYQKSEDLEFDIVNEESDNYKSILTVENGQFYSITDFDKGKSNDSATKTRYDDSISDTIDEYTSTSASLILVDYYNTYLKSNIISGFDSIEPNINKQDGSFSYHISQTWTENTYYLEGYVCEFDISFDKDGNIINYVFNYTIDQYDGSTIEDSSLKTTIFQINDENIISVGEKSLYSPNSFLNVNDYFLIDFDVELYTSEANAGDYYLQDINSVETDRYLSARVKEDSVVPSKALDTELEIIDSTNQDVVSISNLGIVRTVNEGQTTLTIANKDRTVIKTFDVTVKAPSLTEIKVNVYGQFHFVGDTENIYISLIPDNSLDTISITNNTPELITIVGPDAGGYYSVVNNASGHASFTVSSIENPNVSTIFEYDIVNKVTKEEAIANLVGTWFGPMMDANNANEIENAAKIEFFDDFTGQFTCLSNETGMLFEVGVPYEFTYSINQAAYSDRVIIDISDITTSGEYLEVIYNHNTFTLWLDGQSATLELWSDTLLNAAIESDMVKSAI